VHPTAAIAWHANNRRNTRKLEILTESFVGIIVELNKFIDSERDFTEESEIALDTSVQEGDSETVVMIKEILETRIKPAVQQDGGNVVFVKFEDNVVYLRMIGSCSGCPSSSITLKNGIERMLMHWVSEVQGSFTPFAHSHSR
jgi:Fe-S cluster biogenesis protein NfuA